MVTAHQVDVQEAHDGEDTAGQAEVRSFKSLWLAAAFVGVMSLAASAILLVFAPQLSQGNLENLGYLGLFIANLLGTALFLPPVPGLTAAAQGLVIALAATLNPFAVALIAGSAMSLGELSPYIAGRGLRELADQRALPSGRLGRLAETTGYKIRMLMENYGVPTLFALAAVPNPVFEVAGITAGSNRMRIWRFFVPVSAGKFVRAGLLVLIGHQFLHFFS